MRFRIAPVCRPLVLLAVSLLATVPLASAQAQADSAFPPRGQRIRITAPDYALHGVVARFYYVRRDTLVAGDRSTLRVPLKAIVHLEASRGPSAVPIVLGAALGVTAGAAVGVALADTRDCERFIVPDQSCTASVFGPILMGSVLGGTLGAWLGKVLRTERWQDVPLHGVSMSIRPGRTGLRLVVRRSISVAR